MSFDSGHVGQNLFVQPFSARAAHPPSRERWAIVVFAARETLHVLLATLRACVAACQAPMVVDVLVNGNTALAEDMTRAVAKEICLPEGVISRIWSLPFGDKAHAWNEYFHKIWSGEAIVFFCDGYARPNADAVTLLGPAVTADSSALGGSGVPSVGRTAVGLRRSMLNSGGIHGNFCCIKGDVISELRSRQIKLPLGLYRTDSLIGAWLAFKLCPEKYEWDTGRILVHEKASWATDAKHWWKVSDVKSQVKRMIRQYRGNLENEAIKDHLARRKMAPELLPATADELVIGWAIRSPDKFYEVARNFPLCWIAMKHFKRSKDFSLALEPTLLVWASGQE